MAGQKNFMEGKILAPLLKFAIPVSASRNAVAALEKLGASEVRFTEYTDEQMNASGADGAPDATYSYHHVELAVMEDDAYQEWLFSH